MTDALGNLENEAKDHEGDLQNSAQAQQAEGAGKDKAEDLGEDLKDKL